MRDYSNQNQVLKDYRQRRKSRIIYVMGGQCQLCGYHKCQDALELHHINPDEKDFSISSNWQKSWETTSREIQKCALLCANCHREVHGGLYSNIELQSSYNAERAKEIEQEIYECRHGKICYCHGCGVEVEKGKYYCSKCQEEKAPKKEPPDREQLKNEVRTMPIAAVARLYQVGDKTIRRWCVSMNIPDKKSVIRTFSDEDWDKI